MESPQNYALPNFHLELKGQSYLPTELSDLSSQPRVQTPAGISLQAGTWPFVE